MQHLTPGLPVCTTEHLVYLYAPLNTWSTCMHHLTPGLPVCTTEHLVYLYAPPNTCTYCTCTAEHLVHLAILLVYDTAGSRLHLMTSPHTRIAQSEVHYRASVRTEQRQSEHVWTQLPTRSGSVTARVHRDGSGRGSHTGLCFIIQLLFLC